MNYQIKLRPAVEIGVVPTHIKFVGGLVPDAEGKLPRNAKDELVLLQAMKTMCALSPVKLTCIQISYFGGSDVADTAELLDGLKKLGLEIHLILMVGGANPMNPADEDAVVAQLLPGLQAAVTHGVMHVSSTSVEEWMSTNETPREGADFEAAVIQNVKLHLRAYHEAGLEHSCVKNWHIEFLRPGEFKTFTSISRGGAFVAAANKALGKKFFKLLVDAAHCGDSGLTISENEKLIAELAAAGEMGIFHASAKTTRGCLSTDDGWVGALMAAAARTGQLEHVFVEVFHHEDAALEALRNLEPGHGVDTRDGRSYEQVVADGLADVTRRLNNFVARGILKNRH